MGTPEFACASLKVLADSEHNLAAVVTGCDKPSGRGRKLQATPVKKMALELGAPILQPESLRSDDFRHQISELCPDLIVVVAFRILPRKIFEQPKFGSINIHASLLPRYRGAAPINHALLNGETNTGLTSFFLNAKVDTGDLIDQVETEIEPDENYSRLYDRLSEMAGPFLLKSLDLISQSDFKPKVQDSSLASPAPKISSIDGLIDWDQSEDKIHNRIRAFSEKPGAYSFLKDRKIKILGSQIDYGLDLLPLEPGQIYTAGKNLYVGTGGKPILVTRLKPEGKKTLSSEAYLNGHPKVAGNKMISGRKEVKK